MDLSGSQPIAPIYDEKTGAPVPGQAAKVETRLGFPTVDLITGILKSLTRLAATRMTIGPFTLSHL